MENENEEAVDEVVEETEETPEEETQEEDNQETEETEDTVDWKAKATELEGRLKRAETKLKKTTVKPTSKTNELDFGQLAFHNSKTDSLKIESEQDIEFLQETMAETGKSQKVLLNSKWFMSDLEEHQGKRGQAEANKKATPTSKRSVAVSSESIDYWLTQPFDKVPQKLRAKVLNAQLKKEGSPFEFE